MYLRESAKDLKAIKEKKGLTNADIAEATGVPLGTVARVFANQQSNFKWDTMCPIVEFLIDDSNYFNDHIMELYKSIIEEQKQELDAEKENRKAELSEYREEAKKEVTEMKTDFRRSRTLYRVALATEAIITILLIILDYNLPGMGWIFR